MSIFSMDWFRKSKPVEENKEEQKVEKVTVVEDKVFIGDDILDKNPEQHVITFGKPYANMILVNNSLQVILKTGEILVKGNVDREFYDKVKSSTSEQELLELMVPEERKQELKEEQEKLSEQQKEVEEVKKIVDNFDLLVESGEFEVKENSVYLKGINRSLPKLLASKFAELAVKYQNHELNLSANNEFISLKRFWLWTCLNPNQSVCEWLYDFLTQGDFKITKDGMFLSYRRVCKIENELDSNYVDFISNSYVKVKTVWKKSPKNFTVGKSLDGTYSIYLNSQSINWEKVGNLQDLYLGLNEIESNRYTDNYSKSVDIRIGSPVVMPRADCNFTTVDCGVGGYHFANKDFNYYSFGDTGILMLVNPYNVVGIGPNKGRCCEYLPLCTLPLDEERSILGEVDFDTTELEEYYAQEQLDHLEERVKSDYITELGKNEFNIPSFKTEEIKKIITSLEDIKNEITQRVVQV